MSLVSCDLREEDLRGFNEATALHEDLMNAETEIEVVSFCKADIGHLIQLW